MKRFIVTLVAIVAAFGASAQDLRWGATGALNFSWVHTSEMNSSDSYIGFHAGVKAEMDFSHIIADGFYLDGRFLYSLKGGDWAGFHQNLGYVEIPISLGYRLPVSSEVSLMGGLGPYFGLGVIGKNVVSVGDTKTKTDLFGNAYKRFDFGLGYQLGVEVWDQWQFFLGFEHSLLNIAKSDYDSAGGAKVRPLNFYIGTAFMF